MEPVAEYEASAARRTTILAALFIVLTESGAAVLQHPANGEGLRWIYLTHAALAALVALLLWRPRTVDARRSLAAFLAIALPLLPIYWLSQSRSIAAGVFWQPVIGRKLILLGLALLTPHSRAVAAVLLAIFLGECVLLWEHFDLWNDPKTAAAGEPWVTLLFGATTGLLLVQRWRSRRLEQQLLQTQTDTKALYQLMQISLAVRDQVNTPLQSLELSIALLKRRHPAEQPALERMDRSLQRLIELSQNLQASTEMEQGIARLRAVREIGAQLERVEAPH
jgi:hypothetical protein